MPSGDPAVCALQCERDRPLPCSFNLSRGERRACGVLAQERRAATGPAVAAYPVSGAGVVEPRNSFLEVETDRPGGDYRSVEVETDPKGATCKAVCDEDKKCRAWTYARPGYIGKSARCFLKDHVKPPRRKPGFISGVVR